MGTPLTPGVGGALARLAVRKQNPGLVHQSRESFAETCVDSGERGEWSRCGAWRSGDPLPSPYCGAPGCRDSSTPVCLPYGKATSYMEARLRGPSELLVTVPAEAVGSQGGRKGPHQVDPTQLRRKSERRGRDPAPAPRRETERPATNSPGARAEGIERRIEGGRSPGACDHKAKDAVGTALPKTSDGRLTPVGQRTTSFTRVWLPRKAEFLLAYAFCAFPPYSLKTKQTKTRLGPSGI